MSGLKPKAEFGLRGKRLGDSQKLKVAIGGPLQRRRDGAIPRATSFVRKGENAPEAKRS